MSRNWTHEGALPLSRLCLFSKIETQIRNSWCWWLHRTRQNNRHRSRLDCFPHLACRNFCAIEPVFTRASGGANREGRTWTDRYVECPVGIQSGRSLFTIQNGQSETTATSRIQCRNPLESTHGIMQVIVVDRDNILAIDLLFSFILISFYFYCNFSTYFLGVDVY